MAPPTINWTTATELPPIHHTLFSGDNPPLLAELIANRDNSTTRKIRISCSNCKWTTIRSHLDYKSSGNY